MEVVLDPGGGADLLHVGVCHFLEEDDEGGGGWCLLFFDFSGRSSFRLPEPFTSSPNGIDIPPHLFRPNLMFNVTALF